MCIAQNRPISYSRSEMIYHNYVLWDFHGRSYHCTAVGAIWNSSKFTGSTGKSLYSISVLGAKISGVFNTSTGASKYIKIVKNHYPSIFQNFPKLCNTFKKSFLGIKDQFWVEFEVAMACTSPYSLSFYQEILILWQLYGNCEKVMTLFYSVSAR